MSIRHPSATYLTIVSDRYEADAFIRGQYNHSETNTIMLESDLALLDPSSPSLKEHVERYAADQGAFFADFAAAWQKLQELGTAGLRDAL